jgi:glyoxylase-like metal-dependent hydrolase (beta-lactamase superfamily II)
MATEKVKLAVDTVLEHPMPAGEPPLADAVIFTHSHADHDGADDCWRATWWRDGAADLCERGHDAGLKRVFIYAFPTDPGQRAIIPEPHVVDGPFVLGDLEITCFLCRTVP